MEKCITSEFKNSHLRVTRLRTLAWELLSWSRSRISLQHLPKPNSTPGCSSVLPVLTYRFCGAAMFCYNMEVSWMNSVSTLVCVCVCVPCCRFQGCLPAFASSPSLALRRLWISLIIIGCVTQTWGGRCCPPGGLLWMNTVCVCLRVCTCVCACLW